MSQLDCSYEYFTTDLYVKGDNSSSQCGFDNETFIDIPKKLNLPIVVREIACGTSHTLILTNEGQVYGFGSNKNSQLGIPHLLVATAPVQLSQLQALNCVHIGAGDTHSVALTDERDAYLWGSDDPSPRFLRAADHFKCGLNFTVLQDDGLYLHQFGITQQLHIEINFHEFACSAQELFYLSSDNEVHQYGKGVIIEGIQQLFSGYHLSVLSLKGELLVYRNKEFEAIKLPSQVVDSTFSADEGVVLDESNRAIVIDITSSERSITQFNMGFHSIHAGVHHMVLIGALQKGPQLASEMVSREDSVVEENLSPIHEKQVLGTLPQQNNTFSFSIKKDLQMLHSIKQAHKEVQTDEDLIQRLRLENEELKRVQQQQRVNLEIQLQFQRTLQEQILRLQRENENLKGGRSKQELLNMIRLKQADIRKLMNDFYEMANQ